MTDQQSSISSFDREKIAKVVEDAFAKSIEGVDASTALAECATDEGLTKNQTKRACEAFNVSKTLSHYKNSTGVEKAANFDICDPDVVEKYMFPKELATKEASYDLGDDAYSLDSDFTPKGDLGAAPELHPITRDMVLAKFASVENNINLIVSRSEDEYRGSLGDVEDSLNKIAGMVDGLYGDTAASISDELIQSQVAGMVTKAAASRPASTPSTFLSTEVDRCKSLMLIAGDLEKVASEMREERGEFLRKKAEQPHDYLENYPEAFRPMMGSQMSDPMVRVLGANNILGSGNRKTIADNYNYNPYDDPKFQDVRRTKRMLNNTLMLSDFMRNDEVLSKADPKQVIGSFNSIFSNMPQLAENPELARSALRYSVEYGGIDFPTMISAQKTLKDIPSEADIAAGQRGAQDASDSKGFSKFKEQADVYDKRKLEDKSGKGKGK